ncbi:MAG: hypothetical protein LBL08_02125 [Candidatus Nomurabacteria bacterium]|jgi:hypothetical protein|nr:hypothetical protein [Candidatus Nomurabacteria bacterium]
MEKRSKDYLLAAVIIVMVGVLVAAILLNAYALVKELWHSQNVTVSSSESSETIDEDKAVIDWEEVASETEPTYRVKAEANVTPIYVAPKSDGEIASAEAYARYLADGDFGDGKKRYENYAIVVTGTVVSVTDGMANIWVDGIYARAKIHRELGYIGEFVGEEAKIGFTEYEDGNIYITVIRCGDEVRMTDVLAGREHMKNSYMSRSGELTFMPEKVLYGKDIEEDSLFEFSD